MNVSELKVDLINKITNINDSEALAELKAFINFQSDENILKVDDETKRSISISKTQIQNKETITNEALQSEIKQWLGK
jgi:hypothetical protein